jgi:hypothetical protein
MSSTTEAPRSAAAASPRTDRPILIGGGDIDHSIVLLLRRARERELPVIELLVGATGNPSLTWDVEADTLILNGEEIRPGAGFLRYDVFTAMADPRPSVSFRASAWHITAHGWMLAHDDIRMLNRGYTGQSNKPFMLRTAAECGLAIPRTIITNDMEMLDGLQGADDMIAKPVPGGGYTKLLADLLADTPRKDGRSAAPAFVQRRMVVPEVRIYGVGGRFIPFHVISDQLDYRADENSRVELMPLESVDPGTIAALARLMERLQMEYGAADFRTHPDTGELVFLEINSGPMFVGFDAVSNNAVSDAILDYLIG